MSLRLLTGSPWACSGHEGRRFNDAAAGHVGGRIRDLGDTEVRDEGIAVVVKQDVVGFQVSMDQAISVSVRRAPESLSMMRAASSSENLPFSIDCVREPPGM